MSNWTINPNIPPPNGFKFREADGTLITGNDWKRLERAVITHRKQIGGATDGVWDEIIDQICRAAPGFCRSGGQRQLGAIRVNENTKARMLKWLADAVKHNFPPVSDDEAKNRARACMGCPHRTSIELGCSSCQNSVNTLRRKILKGKPSVSAGLGACEKVGEDLGTSIQIKQGACPPEGLPEYCWRKQ